MKIINKPDKGEYAPYTSMYIDLLPDDGLVLKHLSENSRRVMILYNQFPNINSLIGTQKTSGQ